MDATSQSDTDDLYFGTVTCYFRHVDGISFEFQENTIGESSHYKEAEIARQRLNPAKYLGKYSMIFKRFE
jgi:hypothetical protein